MIDGAKQFITNAGTDISGVVCITAAHRRSNGRGDLQPDRPQRHPRLRAGRALPQDGLERVRHAPAHVHRLPRARGATCSARAAAGFKQFLHVLDIGRIGVAAMGVGLAQGALDEALAYAKERKAFGQPISPLPGDPGQARRHGDRDRGRAAARLQGRARRRTAGRNFTLTAAQAKLKTGRLAVRCRRGGRPDPRRLRLHRGVPGLPLLPRRQDPHDRRGHRRGPADGDRPGAGR